MNEQQPKVRVIVVTPTLSKAILDLIETQRRREAAIKDAEAVILSRHLHPEQDRLGQDGHLHFVTFAADEEPDHRNHIPIFGVVDTPQSIEDVHQLAHLHLLKGSTYSVWATDGIPQDREVHAAVVWPIDEALFEEAKACEFNPDRFSSGLNAHLGVAKLAWLTHRRMVEPIENADLAEFAKGVADGQSR